MIRSPALSVAVATLLLSACTSFSSPQNTAQSPHIPTTPQNPTPTPPSAKPHTPVISPTQAAPRLLAAARHPAPQQPWAPQPSYNRIQTDKRVVALTFDDGPHPVLTPQLLDILRDRGVRATFYLIGRNVDAHPQIAQRILSEGHEIGNHSYNHPAFTKLSPSRVASEIQQTNDAILRATGTLPRTLRPPYGATNPKLNNRIRTEFGLPVILWSVDPQDWRYRNPIRVSSHIIQHSQAGDIILAHDIHPSTIAAIPAILDSLLSQGYEFLTVSELLSIDKTPNPQTVEVAASSEPPAVSP